MKSIDQPLEIRGRRIENRIGFAPMGNAVNSDDSLMSDETVELYRAVAAGGTGLLIEGCAVVAEDGRSRPDQLGIWSDSQIPGLEKLTGAVHAEGRPVIAQIQHGGYRSALDIPIGPSDFTYNARGKNITCRAMTSDEIRLSEQQFINAAVRAVKAGYDGVELHASHGWLISSFLSPVTNRRTDKYGKDKLLYLREVYTGIRDAVPDSFIIGVRISGYMPDLAAGLEEAEEIGQMGFDYISVSVNYQIKWLEQDDTVPEDFPFNPMIYAASEIKKIVPVPVFAANGIRNAEDAAAVLSYTDVDMVLVGRGHLCDQQWTKKALTGETPDMCITCKNGCTWDIRKRRCPVQLKKDKGM